MKIFDRFYILIWAQSKDYNNFKFYLAKYLESGKRLRGVRSKNVWFRWRHFEQKNWRRLLADLLDRVKSGEKRSRKAGKKNHTKCRPVPPSSPPTSPLPLYRFQLVKTRRKAINSLTGMRVFRTRPEATGHDEGPLPRPLRGIIFIGEQMVRLN